mmetsp:Transcript_73713/g.116733  ORF Transcript_73713/g.116733 Transcript_73713/m.116733 type:complete len:713 (+) Transcript_73713:78-2216(+)
MDELRSIWAAWSPEVRAEVLQIREPALVQLVEQHMRQLWTAEVQARQLGVQGAGNQFDNAALPLLSTMQFHAAVLPPNGDMTVVHQIVRWPKELIDDAAIMPAMLRPSLEAVSLPRPAKVTHWEQLLHPQATTWAMLEIQMAQVLEQLILHHHAHSLEQRSVNAIASITGHSRSASSSIPREKAPEPEEVEDDDDDRGVEAPANNGRAAKRARQRERRKLFKAAARVNGSSAEDSLLASALSGENHEVVKVDCSNSLPPLGNGFTTAGLSSTRRGSGGLPMKSAVVPRMDARQHPGLDPEMNDWDGGGLSMQPAVVVPLETTPELVQGMRASAVERGVARGAGGGRPADPVPQKLEKQPYVWQPPGLWEPARIMMQDDSLGGGADDDAMLADADPEEVVSIKEVKPPTRRHANAIVTDLRDKENSPEAVLVQTDEVDRESPRRVKVDEWARTRTNSVDELSKMVEKLLVKDGQPQTDPWTGRPIGDGLSMMGLGRGKPMSEGEPQGRFNDLAGMGMGRGRAMAPPPGFGGPQAHRVQRAPGGLSKEWLPGPSIPEEELDPEPQERFLRELQGFPNHLLLEASARLESDEIRTPSVWSKASFCATPSMPWSKTPSPPGTPKGGFFSQPVMHSAYSDVPMNIAGMPNNVANALYNPHVMGAIPMYVTVPVARTHSCPHCGRGFVLAKDADNSLQHSSALGPTTNGSTRDRDGVG